MVKDSTVTPKEIMKIDPMLAMITKDKYLFHLRVLLFLPLLNRRYHRHSHSSKTVSLASAY
jgi:hypothetical protein